jgi:hypothetical protein
MTRLGGWSSSSQKKVIGKRRHARQQGDLVPRDHDRKINATKNLYNNINFKRRSASLKKNWIAKIIYRMLKKCDKNRSTINDWHYKMKATQNWFEL